MLGGAWLLLGVLGKGKKGTAGAGCGENSGRGYEERSSGGEGKPIPAECMFFKIRIMRMN